jgi:uncharacterized membrane protein
MSGIGNMKSESTQKMGSRERGNMVTNPIQMALGIAVVVVLCAIVIICVGPKITAVSSKQWALLMSTLIVLWIPMSVYLIFVVGPSKNVDPRQVVRAGALNLGIGVPLFMFIATKWILKR